MNHLVLSPKLRRRIRHARKTICQYDRGINTSAHTGFYAAKAYWQIVRWHGFWGTKLFLAPTHAAHSCDVFRERNLNHLNRIGALSKTVQNWLRFFFIVPITFGTNKASRYGSEHVKCLSSFSGSIRLRLKSTVRWILFRVFALMI